MAAAERANGFREPVVLGRTGLAVSRLGIGSSYGVPGEAVERSFHEHGVNFFYWGSIRRSSMGAGIRRLAAEQRGRIVIALQSYDRSGFVLERSFRRGLRALGIEYADLLILGWFGSLPSGRVLDAAARLRERGMLRHLALSGHDRRFHGSLLRDPDSPFDVQMFRYNAAHRGAETEILPFVPSPPRPGTVAYTATRWGQLLDRRRMPPGESPLSATDCYRFALSRPGVDVCLTGPADARQLDEALLALVRGPMEPPELERARRIGDFVRSRS